MQTIVRYTLLTASRDWLFIGLVAILFMAYGVSIFMGATALVEQQQMKIAYFAGASRIIIVVGLIVFACFHVRRMFDNREIEAILSKPISRVEFVFAYWIGFVALSFIAGLPVILMLGVLNSPDFVGLLYWAASLYLEMALMLAFAIVAALIMRSAVSSVLACFAFYLLCRLMGFFVATTEGPNAMFSSVKFGWLMEYVLQAISTIVPRLDLYAKSNWLIYGITGQADLWIFQVQSLIYIPLLLAMAVFDFKRKQF